MKITESNHIQNNHNNMPTKNKFYNFEEGPYMNLEYKYNKLKEKYRISKRDANSWRESYFNLLSDSLIFDETIKTLYEENRIHQEYIINLENKINKILQSCNNITNNFHSNLNLNIDTSTTSLNNTYIKNFNEILNDYKKQLDILADEKDQLNTNLSVSRHQQLQTTMRLEELQDRIYRIEKARYDELKLYKGKIENDNIM